MAQGFASILAFGQAMSALALDKVKNFAGKRIALRRVLAALVLELTDLSAAWIPQHGVYLLERQSSFVAACRAWTLVHLPEQVHSKVLH